MTRSARTDPSPRIAYVMNCYPLPSTTFIRREIQAVERHGIVVDRFSLSAPDEVLTQADEAEAAKTWVVQQAGPVRILQAIALAMMRPRSLWAGARTAWSLSRNSRRGYPIHAAYLVEAIVLRAELQRREINHVHSHFATNAAAVAMLCKDLGGPSFSFTAHGPDSFDDALGLSIGAKANAAEFVVAISAYARSQLLRFTTQWDKVVLVRCGVPGAFLEPSPLPSPTPVRFITIGRFIAAKGHRLLIEALAKVVATGRSCHLDLVGDGELRNELMLTAKRLGVDGHISFSGWQDEAEVRDSIQQSHCMVISSFAEGLPVVLMEALGLGRPAIATAIAGIPELVDDSCGWVVPAGSVDALADAMCQAIDAPPGDLEAKGSVGAQRVATRHAATAEAKQLAHHLVQALSRP